MPVYPGAQDPEGASLSVPPQVVLPVPCPCDSQAGKLLLALQPVCVNATVFPTASV